MLVKYKRNTTTDTTIAHFRYNESMAVTRFHRANEQRV